jgi:hypothetical protein
VAEGWYPTRKDVQNAGSTSRCANPDSRNVNPATDLEMDLSEAGNILSMQQYHWGWILSEEKGQNDKPAQGLMFGHPSRLAILHRSGILVIMDAIHNTNRQGWPLFTLMVRDEHGAL